MNTKFVSKEAMDILKKEKLVEQITESESVFKTKYGYLELRISLGGYIPNSPSSFSSNALVDEYVKQASDLLEYYEFYKRLNELADTYPHEYSIDVELPEDVTEMIENMVGKLSRSQLKMIYVEYKEFLEGKRGWKHKEQAEKYGIDVVTLRRYLTKLGIYDPNRHYAPRRRPQQSKTVRQKKLF